MDETNVFDGLNLKDLMQQAPVTHDNAVTETETKETANKALSEAKEEKTETKKGIATSIHVQSNKHENIVVLSGFIAKKTEAKSVVRLVIGIRENVHNRNGVQEEVNYPTVIVMKNKDNSSIADDFIVHDFVKITCHMSSYARQNPSSLERIVIQNLVADKIEPGVTFYQNALDENIGRRVELTQNIVHLRGRVVEIMNRENKSSYLRMEARNGHVRNVVGVYVVASHAAGIKIGDVIDLYGKMKTYLQDTKNKEHPVMKREIIQELKCSIVQDNKENLDTLPTPPKTNAQTIL